MKATTTPKLKRCALCRQQGPDVRVVRDADGEPVAQLCPSCRAAVGAPS